MNPHLHSFMFVYYFLFLYRDGTWLLFVFSSIFLITVFVVFLVVLSGRGTFGGLLIFLFELATDFCSIFIGFCDELIAGLDFYLLFCCFAYYLYDFCYVEIGLDAWLVLLLDEFVFLVFLELLLILIILYLNNVIQYNMIL